MSDAGVQPSKRILAFDIGIKNLAYCVLEGGQIRAWENVNLLVEGTGAGAAAGPTKCCAGACKLNASWSAAGRSYCLRHTALPPLKDMSGAVIKKIPAIATLKELVAHHGCSGSGQAPKKKADYVAALATRFALPMVAEKKPKVKDTNLEGIHDSLRHMVATRGEAFRGCTHILLENQPVFKNPTMKSVQILLFATLREAVLSGGGGGPAAEFHFIHAGKKVQGATKGDAGYSERKGGSEARAKQWLTAPANSAWLRQFEAAPKKSDLADALCMCLDYAGAGQPATTN